MTIKELLHNLARFEAITQSLEDDETKESEWLTAYSNEHKAFTELVCEIEVLTGLSKDTSKRMIITKRKELEAIVSRMQ